MMACNTMDIHENHGPVIISPAIPNGPTLYKLPGIE